jgi:hypothetical protein
VTFRCERHSASVLQWVDRQRLCDRGGQATGPLENVQQGRPVDYAAVTLHRKLIGTRFGPIT